MPALIILEIVEGMLFKPFETFMAPIYELLIDNKFREISIQPSITAYRTKRVDLREMAFYNNEKIVNPQNLRKLANQIKSIRGRPRFIKKISITYQLMDV